MLRLSVLHCSSAKEIFRLTSGFLACKQMDFVLPTLLHSALKVSVYTVVFHKVAAWADFMYHVSIWDLQQG